MSWFKCEMSPTSDSCVSTVSTVGHLGVLILEVMGTLGGGIQEEEAGHYREGPRSMTSVLFLPRIFSASCSFKVR